MHALSSDSSGTNHTSVNSGLMCNSSKHRPGLSVFPPENSVFCKKGLDMIFFTNRRRWHISRLIGVMNTAADGTAALVVAVLSVVELGVDLYCPRTSKVGDEASVWQTAFVRFPPAMPSFVMALYVFVTVMCACTVFLS